MGIEKWTVLEPNTKALVAKHGSRSSVLKPELVLTATDGNAPAFEQKLVLPSPALEEKLAVCFIIVTCWRFTEELGKPPEESRATFQWWHASEDQELPKA